MENIKKEIDSNKENNKGRYPTKLIPYNKQALVWQITLGNMNTAVQAIHYINNIITNSKWPFVIVPLCLKM